MKISTLLSFSTIALTAAFLCGCGDGTTSAGSSAGGVVKCEAAGVMIEGGVVTFVPVAGGSSAFAQIGLDGIFTVETSAGVSGLAPGEYKVAVEIEISDVEDADGNVIPFENPIPEKYWDTSTSGLTVTATEGDNYWTIDLDSGEATNAAKPTE